MNKIYIVNEYYNTFIELDIEKSCFILDGIKYYYKLVEFYKLYIYWLKDQYEIYYTENSFIYYSNIILKNKIKMVYLTNKDWYDEAIINSDTGKVFKFKNNDQYGSYEIINEKLVIDWNKWGREIYFLKNDIYYFSDNINFIEYNDNNMLNNSYPIHIFIHMCCIENWLEIITEQLNLIKQVGLYELVEKIHFGILGDISHLTNNIFNDPKYEIMYIDNNIYLYELHTINKVKKFCENSETEINVLYIHTKGVRRAGNDLIIKSWRNMMEYFLIEKYKECLFYLNDYDTLGNNIINSKCVTIENASINNKHFYHYSGNFWWSKKSYIDKLKYLPLEYSKKSNFTRFKAENWILSNYPEADIGYIYQDNTNTHPYIRYVFDNYKNYPFYVKKLKD